MDEVVRTLYWPEREVEWWMDEVRKLKRSLSSVSFRIEYLEKENARLRELLTDGTSKGP
jgi:hypothetical protein